MTTSSHLLWITSISALLLWFFLLRPPPLLSYDLDSHVGKYTIGNGLRLLTIERHASPTVSVYIRHRAGAVDEADRKTGTAHLLEHMIFKGRQTIGAKDDRLEKPVLDQILSNGLTLHVLANHELPLVKISAVIRTGAMFDSLGKKGLADLSGQVFRTDGIDRLTGDQVDELPARMAAQTNLTAASPRPCSALPLRLESGCGNVCGNRSRRSPGSRGSSASVQ